MNPNPQLSDSISAASLVLAVLAALYSLWLSDVAAALKMKPKPDPADRGPQIAEVNRAIWSKGGPLGVATLTSALILTPRGLAIASEAWVIGRAGQFSDVKALYLLTLGLMSLLAIVSLAQLVGLAAVRLKLGSKP